MIKLEKPFKITDLEDYTLKFKPSTNEYRLKFKHGMLSYFPALINENLSLSLCNFLIENNSKLDFNSDWRKIENFDSIKFTNIEWGVDKLIMYGKSVLAPRFTAWHANTGISYRYAGKSHLPKPWNDTLSFLKSLVESTVNESFNSVLLNWYRDGSDYMGWHADNEKELGKNPIIASLNLGAERRFLLRNNELPNEKIEICLGNGSLLLMGGSIQHHWKHALPKSNRIQKNRINLTFRNVFM
jgi:alkylated DNA repair dioxygenase AlkB